MARCKTTAASIRPRGLGRPALPGAVRRGAGRRVSGDGCVPRRGATACRGCRTHRRSVGCIHSAAEAVQRMPPVECAKCTTSPQAGAGYGHGSPRSRAMAAAEPGQSVGVVLYVAHGRVRYAHSEFGKGVLCHRPGRPSLRLQTAVLRGLYVPLQPPQLPRSELVSAPRTHPVKVAGTRLPQYAA